MNEVQNKQREKHSVKSLSFDLDSSLSKSAQSYADKMASTTNFKYDKKRGNVGENIGMVIKTSVPLTESFCQSKMLTCMKTKS